MGRVTLKMLETQLEIFAHCMGSSVGVEKGQYNLEENGYGCRVVQMCKNGGTSAPLAGGSMTKTELHNVLYNINLALGHYNTRIREGLVDPLA